METWGLHGIFLGVASLGIMLFGMYRRNRCLTMISLGILLVNGGIQSRHFFQTLPRWLYLGLGGISLVSLGGLFEFQREAMIRLGRQWAETLDEWD